MAQGFPVSVNKVYKVLTQYVNNCDAALHRKIKTYLLTGLWVVNEIFYTQD